MIAASVSAVHYHLLGRFEDSEVRGPVGVAKKNASHLLRRHGLAGAVWGKRCKPHPISGRAHQVNVFHYILSHADKGAWTWTFREGLYWLQDEQGKT